MGANLGPFADKSEYPLEGFNGTAAIDSYGMMHQFLNKIRDWETGDPLTDEEGRVTSHISGIFYRSANMMECGVMPLWVWEGGYPDLKEEEIDGRRAAREEAQRKMAEAERVGDMETVREMKLRSISVGEEMEKTANDLIQAMGMPIIYPPSEGEAQCAVMCKEGMVEWVFSQDYDSLMFGSPNMVQNLNSDSGDLIYHEEVLANISEGIGREATREDLLRMGILLGTDYNDSPYGVGPKTALTIIKESESFDDVINAAHEKDDSIDPRKWEKVYEWFEDPDVDLDVEYEWEHPDEDKVRDILIEKHGFSEKRVGNALEKITEEYKEQVEKHTIDEFL